MGEGEQGILMIFSIVSRNEIDKGEGYKQGRMSNRDPETAQKQRLQRPETEQTLKKHQLNAEREKEFQNRGKSSFQT